MMWGNYMYSHASRKRSQRSANEKLLPMVQKIFIAWINFCFRDLTSHPTVRQVSPVGRVPPLEKHCSTSRRLLSLTSLHLQRFFWLMLHTLWSWLNVVNKIRNSKQLNCSARLVWLLIGFELGKTWHRRGNGFCYNCGEGEKRWGGNSRARKAIATSAPRGRKNKDNMAKYLM